MLERGKKYKWRLTKGTKSGVFIGEYDDSGNAIMKTKNGEVWSIPVEDIIEYKKGVEG